MFAQQGLEKLNDLSTKYFQRGSNHREDEALRQMLERMNRLETLEDAGHCREKRPQKCSICSCVGHVLVLLDHACKNMTRTAVDR